MKAAKELAVSVLGTRPVSAAVERVLRGRLRVVAYHGVADADAFRRQLDLVASRYVSVCGADVVAAMNGGPPLPERAVWITFDDGHSSVVEYALPLLRERNMSATLFVCPGLVQGGEPPWWEVVEFAAARGWVSDGLPAGRYVQALKALPDSERRRHVADAHAFSKQVGGEVARPVPVAGPVELGAWLNAGMELGNHTWDHPCLDMCAGDDQRRQIVEADRWLERIGAFESGRLFAYPNGDWTQDSERVLVELGYDVALLFDHRLADVAAVSPLRMSRVRLDTGASVERARAILSGGHSMLYRPSSPIVMISGAA
jgi:peptidoglycan/xylan/chitin deacetylase (PgdA/CDA1 family)